jgi:DNA polymerase-3 subunit alpha
MGKKIPEVMKKERRNFIAGSNKKGFSTEVAAEVFDLIEPFAGYAFNKAHSVSYALIAYQTAYLKANYPAEYITAFLTIHAGQLEKVANAVAECRRLNITVLPPDINRSQLDFSIEKDGDGQPAIRIGLATIKNVGTGAVEPIIAERSQGGDFKSIEDLCRRCDLRVVNRRVMESLIKTGVLDSLQDRGTLLNSVSRILSLAQREQRLRETGQSTMFDLWGEEAPVPLAELDLTPSGVSDREKAVWEKELMGASFSEKPFSPVISGAGAEATFCGQIDAELAGQSIVVAGRVISVRDLLTKDNRSFASAILEDFSGQVEVMVWPKAYAEAVDLWQEGSELIVQGKVRLRDDRVQISCDNARHYQPAQEKEPIISPEPVEVEVPVEAVTIDTAPAESRRLVISVSQTSDADGDIARLDRIMAVLKVFPGQDEVQLNIANGEEVTNLRLSNIYTNCCPELEQRLVELVGQDGFRLESYQIIR